MRTLAFELANRHGDPLRGDVRFQDGADPLSVVVVCHGFKGFKDWGFFPYVGQQLAEAGFLCVCFNFSGSGIGPDLQNFTEMDRFASDTMSRQIEDLGCILDALESGQIGQGRAQPGACGVLGHSKGGATAILRARDDERLRAVVTWASVSRLMRYSERELSEWREQGFMEFLNSRTNERMRIDYTMVEDYLAHRDRFDLERAVSELRVPFLILHGEEDLSVRVREAHELHQAADPSRSRLVVLPKTGHTFGIVHPWEGATPVLDRMLEESVGWFKASLGVGQQRSGTS